MGLGAAGFLAFECVMDVLKKEGAVTYGAKEEKGEKADQRLNRDEEEPLNWRTTPPLHSVVHTSL